MIYGCTLVRWLCFTSCVHVDDIVDTMVDKVGACKAQIVTTRKNRHHSSLDDCYQMNTDLASVVHESKLVTMVFDIQLFSWFGNEYDMILYTDGPLQLAVTSQSAIAALNPSLDTTTTHTFNSFTQDHLIPHSQSSDSMLLDVLSEEVKSKYTPTEPLKFQRSHSSEASSPVRSISSLSPRHHSLYGENPLSTSPLSNRSPVQSVSPGNGVGK